MLGGGVAVCLVFSAHRAVIFAIAQLSCYTSANGSGRRYYILLLKFLSFFFLSSQDLRDGSTDREPF